MRRRQGTKGMGRWREKKNSKRETMHMSQTAVGGGDAKHPAIQRQKNNNKEKKKSKQ